MTIHADRPDALVRARAISAATEMLRGAETHRQFGTLGQAHKRLASHIDSASAAYHLPVLSRACVATVLHALIAQLARSLPQFGHGGR